MTRQHDPKVWEKNLSDPDPKVREQARKFLEWEKRVNWAYAKATGNKFPPFNGSP